MKGTSPTYLQPKPVEETDCNGSLRSDDDEPRSGPGSGSGWDEMKMGALSSR